MRPMAIWMAMMVGWISCLSGCERRQPRETPKQTDPKIDPRRTRPAPRPTTRDAAFPPPRAAGSNLAPSPSPPRPTQAGIDPLHKQITGKTTCRVFDGYVVFSTPYPDQVGDRIRVKKIPTDSSLAPVALCADRGPPFVFEHTDRAAASYLAGLAHDRLLLDDGTGQLRTLFVIDLATGKRVFTDRYVGKVRHFRGNTILYDQPLDGGDLPSCEPKDDCATDRQERFARVKKSHAPRFDKTRAPSCPKTPEGAYPEATLLGRWLLDLETLKRIPLPQVTCVLSE